MVIGGGEGNPIMNALRILQDDILPVAADESVMRAHGRFTHAAHLATGREGFHWDALGNRDRDR